MSKRGPESPVSSSEGRLFMKIGELSRRLDIPVETIRYYVRSGIIVPDRAGKQYDFCPSSVEDLKRVLDLKRLGFSLNEIHRILSLLRISDPCDPEDTLELVALYSTKKDELEEKVRQLAAARDAVAEEIQTIYRCCRPQNASTGVPLRALALLACPLCRGRLSLTDASVDARYVHEGTVCCSCGYRAEIRRGILRTPNVNRSRYDKPDTTRELYKDLPSPLISLFTKAHNWMLDRLGALGSSQVVMETHANASLFLYIAIAAKRQSSDKLYVIIDKFPETLEMYKRKIEFHRDDLDILYLADASLDFPLADGCIDGFIDFFGSNEHQFYRHDDLLVQLDRFFSPKASLLGTYFHMPPMGVSARKLCREYPEAYIHNFNLRLYRQALDRARFSIVASDAIGSITDSGENLAFSFHVKEEELSLFSLLAQRTQPSRDEPEK